MTPETRLRERLHATADGIGRSQIPMEGILRRGRRRLIGRRLSAAVATAIVLAALGWSVATVTHLGTSGRSTHLRPGSAVRGAQVTTIIHSDFKAGSGLVSSFSVSGSGIWVTTNGRRISRLSPKTGRVIRSVAGGGGSLGSVIATADAAWVASYDSKGDVARLDPQTLQVTALVPAGVPGVNGITFMAAGRGSLWVLSGTHTIDRIDMRTARIVARIPLPVRSSSPIDTLADIEVIDGTPWIAGWRHGVVWRIDPGTNRVTTIRVTAPASPDPLPSAGPGTPTPQTDTPDYSGAFIGSLGGSGRYVIACCSVSNELLRIDATTGEVTDTHILIPIFGHGPALVSGGRWVWAVTSEVPLNNTAHPGFGTMLYRIDPTTLEVFGPIAERVSGPGWLSPRTFWQLDDFEHPGSLARVNLRATLPRIDLVERSPWTRNHRPELIAISFAAMLGLGIWLARRRRTQSIRF